MRPCPGYNDGTTVRANATHRIFIAALFTFMATSPGYATEFLGVELCLDRVDTGVILPVDSPLSLESVEVGRHGGPVLLLHSKSGRVLEQVDDLMMSFTGTRGSGDDRRLEWSGNQITGFAQLIKQDYVALAVSAAATSSEIEAETAGVSDDFTLKGRLMHAAAEDGWVDLMGVVVNSSGELISVDTVSVNKLREGQERASPSWIPCADCTAESIVSWKLQFAGGH